MQREICRNILSHPIFHIILVCNILLSYLLPGNINIMSHGDAVIHKMLSHIQRHIVTFHNFFLISPQAKFWGLRSHLPSYFTYQARSEIAAFCLTWVYGGLENRHNTNLQ
jgi:hypothetical protein